MPKLREIKKLLGSIHTAQVCNVTQFKSMADVRTRDADQHLLLGLEYTRGCETPLTYFAEQHRTFSTFIRYPRESNVYRKQ